MITLPDVVAAAVFRGVSVTLETNVSTGELFYNMNTGAKSHMHIFVRDEKVIAEMRYGDKEEINDFDDLLYAVKRCMHGRDYMNSEWVSILINEGVLERVETVQVSYR